MSFLSSDNHWDCWCFEPPQSLNLDFQVFVFGKLLRGFIFIIIIIIIIYYYYHETRLNP